MPPGARASSPHAGETPALRGGITNFQARVVDSLDSIVERMHLVLERHKAYVEQHTDILRQALAWANNQHANHYLLVGKQRTAAEDWLHTEFRDGEQPPCVPNDLICDFICEARKNAENRMTDCFVCYDHSDKAVRDAVVRSLARYAVTTWRHDSDIAKGRVYDQAIEEGIEGADNFLFFISPAAVQSEYCLKELAHALKYHKRIIPLLIAGMPVINHETDEIHEKNPDENFRVFRDFRGSNVLIPEESVN